MNQSQYEHIYNVLLKMLLAMNRVAEALEKMNEEPEHTNEKLTEITPAQKALLENKISALRERYSDADILRAIDEFIYGRE